jgi:hypothetical protein
MNVEVKAWVYECGDKVNNHKNGLNPDVFCMMYDGLTQKYFTAFMEYDTGKDDPGKKRDFLN